MTGEERNALLLAARILESGVPVEAPDPTGPPGHVGVALALSERLRRIAEGPEHARQIVDSLRAAAREPSGA